MEILPSRKPEGGLGAGGGGRVQITLCLCTAEEKGISTLISLGLLRTAGGASAKSGPPDCFGRFTGQLHQTCPKGSNTHTQSQIFLEIHEKLKF